MNEMKGILQSSELRAVEQELPRSQLLLFAPVDKRAFGAAIGTAVGLGVFALTALDLVLEPEISLHLELLAQYFAGYRVSWPGALIGAAWGFFSGFCAGWFTAFARNLALALSLFILKSRAELSDSRDFLDHI